MANIIDEGLRLPQGMTGRELILHLPEQSGEQSSSTTKKSGKSTGFQKPMVVEKKSSNQEGPSSPESSLKDLPKGFSHSPRIRRIAESYMKGRGTPYTPPSDYAPIDEARSKNVASRYEAMAHNPSDPATKEAYDALIKETGDQFQAMKDAGINVEFTPEGKDPYSNTQDMIDDVHKNNHMYVYPTTSAFGNSGEDASDHPMLAPTEHTISGRKALANDLFRATHDFFGHAKEGLPFAGEGERARGEGEYNAYRQHHAMYSPKAQQALASETDGQNSWLNYGPHGEHNKNATSFDQIKYAPQKAGIMGKSLYLAAGALCPPKPLVFAKSDRSIKEDMNIQGLKICIENPIGSTRHFHDLANGSKGSCVMKHAYGYIKGTMGVDGDEVDCFIGPDHKCKNAYVIRIKKAPDFVEWDEDKCMIGFDSPQAAKKAFLENYDSPKFFGEMHVWPMSVFKRKVLATYNNPHLLKSQDDIRRATEYLTHKRAISCPACKKIHEEERSPKSGIGEWHQEIFQRNHPNDLRHLAEAHHGFMGKDGKYRHREVVDNLIRDEVDRSLGMARMRKSGGAGMSLGEYNSDPYVKHAAIKVNGKVHVGRKGEWHDDLEDKHGPGQRGFINHNGQYYSERQIEERIADHVARHGHPKGGLKISFSSMGPSKNVIHKSCWVAGDDLMKSLGKYTRAAALRTPKGVYEGKRGENHGHVYEQLSPQEQDGKIESGFIGHDGKFYERRHLRHLIAAHEGKHEAETRRPDSVQYGGSAHHTGETHVFTPTEHKKAEESMKEESAWGKAA